MFLIRPYPQVGESLVGYMIRVALANRIRSLSHFRSLVEVKLPEFERNIVSEDSLDKLGTLTNQTAAKLTRMTSNSFHEELKNDHFNLIMTRRVVQFCPLCIEEGAYHRKIWLVSVVIICPVHGVNLINKCSCEHPISMLALMLNQCEFCNRELSTLTPMKEYDHWLMDSQAKVVKLFDTPDARIKVAGLELTMSQFVLLCRHSFSLVRNYSSSTNEEINTPDLSKGRCDFSRGDTICKVLRIYENFPTNFGRVIDQFFSRSKKSKDKYDLEKLFLDPIFDPIMEVYHNFLTTRSSRRTGCARPSLSYLNRDHFQYIPRALAVDILGVKHEDLESLIRLGILKEYEVKCQNFLDRDQVFALFNQCKGDIRSTYRRISIREVLNKYARKGITFTCLVLLIINSVVRSGSSVLCNSLMDVTFDVEELKVCLERIMKKDNKKGRVNMQRDNNDVLFGLATVTGQGIVFNDRIYSNTQMIKHQWFELAQKSGSWTIPILFNPAESEHVFILDTGGLEVASSLERGAEVEPLILESYYQALNVLKEQIRLKKRD